MATSIQGVFASTLAILCIVSIIGQGNGFLLDNRNITTCEDQGGIDCSALDVALKFCTDVVKAKIVCRSFCGLCDLADGQWSLWSSWGQCDVSCGNGIQTRRRLCNNPAPAHGGINCMGSDRDTQSCTQPLCPGSGNWGSWNAWGSCSVSCGQGLQRRDRYCDSPPPTRLGDHCFGSSVDFKLCTHTCFGHWSSWSGWSHCSQTCDSVRFRDRDCTATVSVQQDPICVGSSVETQPCNCPVRLAGGTNAHNGRLELFHNGMWGTVCDDSFTNSTARAICNMLSYPSSSAYFQSNTVRTTPPHKIWLDEVVCSGSVSNIDSCSHQGWGITDCSHSEDVTIICSQTNTQVRLTGGAYNGRLEVFHGGLWGTVCDDSFTDSAAMVICRMLNYSPDYAHFTSHDSTSHPSKIWLDDVVCSGSESDIAHCAHASWGTENCGHGEDVYINCYPATPRAFTATNPTVDAHNHVAFSTVVSSTGNGYKSNTGTFTCLSQGQYIFDVSFTKKSAYGSRVVHCFLRLNGANMVLINVNSGNYFESVSVTFSLLVGDRVDIGSCSGANYLEGSTSVFTGYQIRLD